MYTSKFPHAHRCPAFYYEPIPKIVSLYVHCIINSRIGVYRNRYSQMLF